MFSYFCRYRLNQCRQILHHSAKCYREKKNTLSTKEEGYLKNTIQSLDEAIQRGNRSEADQKARELDSFCKTHFKRNWVKWVFEVAFALAFALAIATVIRQMWFELYEIPTGSMRPTFKEQDHLTVSKTQFGINIPLQTAHFYFNPALVERSGTIIFSGDKLPLRDTDTTFLGIFPYKKRYVKRMIGKPGDTFFFYGGKLYGIDQNGEFIEELQNSPSMAYLDYVPFLSFEGQASQQKQDRVIFSYFNIPFGRITQEVSGKLKGEIYDGKKWIPDHLSKEPKEHIQSLSDLFGMGNYAMAQIYTKDQLQRDRLEIEEEAPLYLVLRHTPHLDFSKGDPHPLHFPKTLTAILPLGEEEIKTLMKNMYTSRFIVEEGKVKRYNYGKIPFSKNPPRLDNTPDGTYEFYYGIAYQIHFGGIAKELPKEHPLYEVTPERVQLLFNLGIQWDNAFQPKKSRQGLPNRYVYFREGDLYALGAPLLKKGNPQLEKFIEKEMAKQKDSASEDPYIAFIDKGAPGKDDLAKFGKFGLKITEKNYLVLGDNHAMSADSRVFGFVPEENLQGVPDLILWPPGDRLGKPNQTPYPTFVTPRLIIWMLAFGIALISYLIYSYRLRRPIKL